LRGLDLNQRPLGYELSRGHDGNPLIIPQPILLQAGQVIE
jgi:hypothetical protein